MTHTAPAPSPVANPVSVRTGTAWIVGGLAWLAAGLLQADVGWRFGTAAVVWFGADLLISAGLVGLLILRPHGRSRIGTAALVVALAARVAFAAGEIASLAAGNDEGPLIPLGALLTAVAMTAYGVTVFRRHRTGGSERWSFLVMGIYPFIAMFPVLAITGEPSPILIAGWGLPAACIGYATLRLPSSSTSRGLAGRWATPPTTSSPTG